MGKKKERRRRHKRVDSPRHWITCPHCPHHAGGFKRSYQSRKAALRAKKVQHLDSSISAYRCPHDSELWHLGHLPRAVQQGITTRGEMYQ